MSEPEMMDALLGVFRFIERGEFAERLCMVEGIRRGRPEVVVGSFGQFEVSYQAVYEREGKEDRFTITGCSTSRERCLEAAREWASKTVSRAVERRNGPANGEMTWEEIVLMLDSAGVSA